LEFESADLIEVARQCVQAHTPVSLEIETWTAAAVLLLLYRVAGSEHILFTVRSNEVEHHKGQISFPGGAVHEADRDLEMTALRETYEEVGLDPEHIEVVGRLDDIITNSPFRVTPVVAILHGGPYEFVPSPAEVGEILEVPLRHLLDPNNVLEDRRARDGEASGRRSYTFGGHHVWGATARILTDFLQMLPAGGGRGEGSGTL
jgi:8-oxo-dGTP pyrophosphatase MutT (NUDIX family)